MSQTFDQTQSRAAEDVGRSASVCSGTVPHGRRRDSYRSFRAASSMLAEADRDPMLGILARLLMMGLVVILTSLLALSGP